MTDEEKIAAEAAEAAATQASASPSPGRGKAKATTALVEVEDKPETGTFTVAKGRTLVVDGEDRRAGDEIEIELKESRSLIAAGFLDNPDADAPVILTGPKIQRVED